MSFIINILGFFILSTLIAYKGKRQISHILPIVYFLLIIILMVLAMLRRMSYIDHIMATLIIVVLIGTVISRKRIEWDRIRKLYSHISIPVLLISIAIISFAAINRVATDWDELGCWALEVKTLYLADGFSIPGMHTTIGYADYYPGQMLILWWFTHLQPHYFNEGLMYVGYYIFYICIVFEGISEILDNTKIRYTFPRICFGVTCCMFLLFLPSTVSVFEYKMLSVELLQSATVGAMIYKMFRNAANTTVDWIDHIKWISLSIILMSLKDSSVVFLFITFIWGIVLNIVSHKRYITFVDLCGGILGSIIVAVTWKSFVNANGRATIGERSSRFISAINELLNNRDGDFANESFGYVTSFIKSIKEQPLHLSRGFGLDLSVKGVITLSFILFIVIYIKGYYDLSKLELIASIICASTSIVFYLLVILSMHIFFFRETQYLDDHIMMMSISRYCEPLILGLLLFFVLTFLIHGSPGIQAAVLIGILFFSEYSCMKNGLWGYRENVTQTLAHRQEIESSYSGLMQGATGARKKEQGRIIILFDNNNNNILSDQRNISYMMAPKSVSFMAVSNDDINGSVITINDYINKESYEYYYVVPGCNINEKFNIQSNTLYSASEIRPVVEEGD